MNIPHVTLESRPLEALEGGDNLLQSGFWGAHKARFGWTPHAYTASFVDLGVQAGILVLCRPLPLGRPLAYVPLGPDLALSSYGKHETTNVAATLPSRSEDPGVLNGEQLRMLADELSRVVRVDTVRYDLPAPVHIGGDAPGKREFGRVLVGLRPAIVDVQPASTVVLDISGDEKELLAGMKPKTRYNVNLAERKGVEVHEMGREGLSRWYDMYRETAARDRIAIHSFEYYKTLFEIADSFSGKVPELRLYLASHEGEDLAGIITSFFGHQATYLYGASSNRKRNLMPAYALQWRAIRDARAAGCASYDLFGIPPSGDSSHPMAGLYQFKTGFGGRIVHRPGCWDVAVNPFFYALYRTAEAGRSYYFHRVRKHRRPPHGRR